MGGGKMPRLISKYNCNYNNRLIYWYPYLGNYSISIFISYTKKIINKVRQIIK